MIEIIGIRFKDVGKIYYFDPDGQSVSEGDHCIVETARGVEIGKVVIPNRHIPSDSVSAAIKKITRVATGDDMKRVAANKEKEKTAAATFSDKIQKHGLDMKLVDVQYTFDGGKILFYFTADGRIDFRELVKDLASVFRTRIELRQIGVRDEAKMLGGLGICGKAFCCSTFLGEFQPVSIKMAKEQGLSLNPAKISGTCGRLMCCLKYEQDAYEELLNITPKIDAYVSTKDGKGYVTDNNLLTGMVYVKLENQGDAVSKPYHRDEVKILRDAQIRLNKSEIEQLKRLEGQ